MAVSHAVTDPGILNIIAPAMATPGHLVGSVRSVGGIISVASLSRGGGVSDWNGIDGDRQEDEGRENREELHDGWSLG